MSDNKFVKELNYEAEVYRDFTEPFDPTLDKDQTNSLIQELTFTLDSLSDKAFVCANEIGRSERAVAIKFGDESQVFFNPVFMGTDEPKLVREIDYNTKLNYIIPRFTKVSFMYTDYYGKEMGATLSEQASIVMHQVIDCLDGVHDDDYGLELNSEFDQASEEDKNELLMAYVESLKQLETKLDEELSTDDETKREWMNYKFQLAKDRGEVESETVVLPRNRRERRLFKRLEAKRNRQKKGNTNDSKG